MIEVLVSLIIIQVGLLGLVGTQVMAQRAESEAYQRAQAVILMQDMVERINANRYYASCFAYTDPTAGTPYLGVNDANHYTTTSCSVGANAGMVQASLDSWDSELQGAAERDSGGTNKIGAVTSARGCVSSSVNAGGYTIYTVAVVWQGQTPLFSPVNFPNVPTGAANCAKDLYDTDGTDRQRRLVWTTVQIASLQ